MEAKGPKIKTIILNIFISLVLLPVGERLFTPIHNEIVHKVLSAQNTGLKFLSDFLYSRISEGVYVNIPFYIFIVLISFFLGVLMHNVLTLYKSTSSCCDSSLIASCTKRKELNFLLRLKCFVLNPKSCKSLALSGYVAIYLFFFLFLLTTNFVNLNITKLTNNIEILGPYISDYEYKVLKSNFHSISSRNDFDSFNHLLNEYANKAGIKLK